jgi:hypothetical protein
VSIGHVNPEKHNRYYKTIQIIKAANVQQTQGNTDNNSKVNIHDMGNLILPLSSHEFVLLKDIILVIATLRIIYDA